MSAALVDPDMSARLAQAGDVPLSLLDSDEAKTCHCGTVFYRDGRSRVEFRARHSCSIVCGQQAKDRADCPPRTCERAGCGETIPRKPGVEPHKYRKVKFCSTACRMSQRRADAIEALPTKTCPCGKTFTKRLGTETAARFEARTCCSRPCEARNRVGRAEMGDQPETKTCLVCSEEFTRLAGDHGGRWARKEYCGRSCAATKARRSLARSAPKTCPQCSTVFERDYDTETSRLWARRVCCTETCTKARKAARRAARENRPRAVKPASAATVTSTGRVIPPKPEVPRVVWRPGMGEDGTGELAPGFAREVQVWGRRGSVA